MLGNVLSIIDRHLVVCIVHYSWESNISAGVDAGFHFSQAEVKPESIKIQG